MPQSDSHRCPAPEKLARYLYGQVAPDEADTIVDHLEQCTRCEEVAVRLESQCRLPALPEFNRVSANFIDEPQCWVARQRAALAEIPESRCPRSFEHPMIVGEYELQEQLGGGGMGLVFRAWGRVRQRAVAVKILARDTTRRGQAARRFEREIEAMGSLQHPNIVRALDAGETDGTPYFAMELVDGVDLGDLVRQCGALNPHDACELIRQAATGLQYAHDQGVVHRDIKPSNLMVTYDQPTVKILDLGLAIVAADEHDLTESGQLLGTLDYLAPEQGVDMRQVDQRSDIYSLGATLYKLLTAKAPFSLGEAVGPLAKLTAVARGESVPVIERRSDLPPPLVDIVGRMMARDKEDRFASASEVADALAPFAAGADLDVLMSQVSRVFAVVQPALPNGSRRRRWIGALYLLAIAPALLAVPLAIQMFSPRLSDEANSQANRLPVLTVEEARPNAESDEAVPADRFITNWTLRRGGTVTIESNGRFSVLSQDDTPPTEAFSIVGVNLNAITELRAEEFRRFRELKRLGTLQLSATDVDDRAITAMGRLPAIESIGLGHSRATDAGLELVVQWQSLRYLGLSLGPITNDGLRHLAQLPKLQQLYLRDSGLSDVGIQHLRSVSSLTHLYIGATAITDEAIRHLTMLPSLTHLDINATRVGDESVPAFAEMDQLRFLNVRECRFTTGGIRALREALPNCQVETEQPSDSERGWQSNAGL